MKVLRKYVLGSEWVYVKIYCGALTQERLLANEVVSLVSELYKNCIIRKFFFVRYDDHEGAHIRLRFLLVQDAFYSDVISLININFLPYLRTREIQNIAYDIYKRELERYGASNIEDVETAFCLSSQFILLSLKNEPQETIWLLSLKFIDDTFDCCNIDYNDRKEIVEDLFQSFFHRFGGSKSMLNNLADQYRKFKVDINTCLAGPVETLANNMKIDKSMMVSVYKNIQLREEKLRFYNILKSIIHMHLNRSFSHNQNTFELVVYFMLSKYYSTYINVTKSRI